MRNIFIFLFIVLVACLVSQIKMESTKVIDLPEEIEEAKPGDLLKVERVTKDTIYLGYTKNK